MTRFDLMHRPNLQEKQHFLLVGNDRRKVECRDQSQALSRARLLRACGVWVEVCAEWREPENEIPTGFGRAKV